MATLTLFRVGALVSPQGMVDAGMQSPPALGRPPMLRRPIGWVDDDRIDDERGCGEGGMIPASSASVCERGFTGCPGSTNRRTDERHWWSAVPGCPQSTCCSQLSLTSCAERLGLAVHACSMQCRCSADAVCTVCAVCSIQCIGIVYLQHLYAACTYISTYRKGPDRIECTYFCAFASAPSGDATTRCVTISLRTVQTEPPSCCTRICSRFVSASEPRSEPITT